MLLAARALGLGATLTTLCLQFEKEAEAALGLPLAPNFPLPTRELCVNSKCVEFARCYVASPAE